MLTESVAACNCTVLSERLRAAVRCAGPRHRFPQDSAQNAGPTLAVSPASGHIQCLAGLSCQSPPGLSPLVWSLSQFIKIGSASLFKMKCRNQTGSVRFKSRAGGGISAHAALASARPRNATRCCTAASSPRRSCRCVSGSARRPRCRPARGSHASPPTD